MRKTNQQIVKELMTFSQFGALAEAFVVDALMRETERIAAFTDEEIASMRGGLVNPVAWRGVAREMHGKLDTYYGPKQLAA